VLSIADIGGPNLRDQHCEMRFVRQGSPSPVRRIKPALERVGRQQLLVGCIRTWTDAVIGRH
jgi:hypothetical protein